MSVGTMLIRFRDKRGVRERSGAFLSPVAAKRHPQADVSLSTRGLAAPSAQTGLREAPLVRCEAARPSGVKDTGQLERKPAENLK